MKKILTTIIIPIVAFIGLMCISEPVAAAADEETIEPTTIVKIIEPAAQETEYQLGDVNGDNRINVVDASWVLNAYAKYQTGEEPLTPLQKEAADINGDGSVDSVDASEILSYYVYSATTKDEKPLGIKEFYISKYAKISNMQVEKVYFKPSTHYIHRSTCHWVNEDCHEEIIEIENTNDIECRVCTECNPEMTIVNPYVATPVNANNTGLSDYDRRLLAEVTCHEYGSNWVSTAEKAKIVAGVMNRVNSASFPNTVYDVLMQPGQFHGSWDGGHGYWPGCIEPNQDSWAAVDYYFEHQNEFGSWTSWWGDGTWNYFY